MKLYIVDAFTIAGNSLSGNPAAICILEQNNTNLSEEEKGNIAKEINASMTAFLTKLSKDNQWKIQFFEHMGIEIPICGHASFAAGWLLLTLIEKVQNNQIYLITSKEEKEIVCTLDSSSKHLTMSLPMNSPQRLDLECTSLNSWPREIVMNVIGEQNIHLVQDVQASETAGVILIHLTFKNNDNSSSDLEAFKPNFEKLRDTVGPNSRYFGVGITTILDQDEKHLGNNQVTVYSRFFIFNPNNVEEPFCGLWHTVMVPYWFNYFHETGKKLTSLNSSMKNSKRASMSRVSIDISNNKVLCTGKGRIFLEGNVNISTAS